MSDLHRLIWSTLVGVFRSRIATLAEIMVLRHQLNMLRRRSPKRAVLNNIDRLVFVGLYRVAPQVLEMLQIIKPEGDPLASRWFSSLLALEIMTARWPAGDAT